MEDDIELVWYALLDMIGLCFIANAAFIIASIYEAEPMPKRTSSMLKDSIRFRNTFLQFLAGCNVVRAFTLYLIGVARGGTGGTAGNQFYAGAEFFKDVVNLCFAAIFSMITLFFMKLYKTHTSSNFFRFSLLFVLIGLVGYIIIGILLVATADDVATYQWANSLIVVLVFLFLLLVILYYGIGLIFQVKELERLRVPELPPMTEGEPEQTASHPARMTTRVSHLHEKYS
jgi:hypothetical protein